MCYHLVGMRNYVINIFGSVSKPRARRSLPNISLNIFLFIALCTLMSNGKDFEENFQYIKASKETVKWIMGTGDSKLENAKPCQVKKY